MINLLGETIELGGKIKEYFFSQGEFFVNKPFVKDKRITKEISEITEDTTSSTSPSNKLKEGIGLPLLGTPSNDKDVTFLSEDAAALCQYVYEQDDFRPHKILYHTKSYVEKKNGWYIYNEKETRKTILQTAKNEIYCLLGHTIGSNKNSEEELCEILKGRLTRNRTGFFSKLFYQKNNNKIVRMAYVTEGTTAVPFDLESENENKRLILGDRIGDTIANVGQGLLGLSPQHTLSVQNAKIIAKYCDLKGIPLYFFGHSLGGGLAVANAIATGKPAIVFNMAGLHWSRLLRYKKNYDLLLTQHNILSYWTDNDFLSHRLWDLFLLKHNGNRYNIGSGKHDLIGICKKFHLTEMKNRKEIPF